VIALENRPLALEDRPQLESTATPRPNIEPAASEARAERQAAAPLTMAGVTASLQLILAARRAARIAKS
jgi:hypothetical protein